MSEDPGALDRLKYKFNNYFSRGGGWFFVIFVVLFALFVVAVFVLRLVLSLALPSGTYGADSGPVESAIVAFLQTFDPGYMAGELSASRWFLAAAVIAGLGGIVLVAILIAFTDRAFDERLVQLRRGHSPVVETGHTLILGWEEQRVVEITKELAKANEKGVNGKRKRREKAIVVLANQRKEYMDDYLRRHVKSKSTRLVTRSGSPSSIDDLKIVSVSTAKSVIILSECSYAANDVKKEEADARVLKTLLAVEHLVPAAHDPDAKADGVIVVDLFRSKARRASRLVRGDTVEAVDVKNVLARILLQTSRSVGLSEVYDELLSFRGAEIYVTDKGRPWASESFGDASLRFTGCIPIGIKHANERSGMSDEEISGGCVVGRTARLARRRTGQVTMNPPPEMSLNEGDRLIVLAQDDSDISVNPKTATPNPGAQRVVQQKGDSTGDVDGELVTSPSEAIGSSSRIRKFESQLLIGWGPKTTRLLDEYVQYVEPQSKVDIMKRAPENVDPSEGIKRYERCLDMSVLSGDPTDPSTWGNLEPHKYDHIIILSDGDRMVTADVVDARTITILLLLRNAIGVGEKPVAGEGSVNESRPTIVTELVESDNRVIAPRLGEHDFVVSSRIVSMLFAQIAEKQEMHEIYKALFQEWGSEIYINPCTLYTLPDADRKGMVEFGELMEKVESERREICIGVKTQTSEGNEDGGTELGPKFGVQLISDRMKRINLDEVDSLIVLAEHEHVPDEIVASQQ